MDVDWWAEGNTLIVLSNYLLYTVDPSSGDSQQIMVVPDGDGFPSISTVAANTFFFADFEHVFSVALTSTSAKVVTKEVFDGYFCVSNFHFNPQ